MKFEPDTHSIHESPSPELQLRLQELQESESRYRAIFESSHDAIVVHDAQTGAILDVNSRAEEVFATPREQFLRMDVEAFSAGEPPYSQKEAMAWMAKAAAGEPQVFEWRGRRGTGELFWAEVSMRAAEFGGGARLIVIVRDVEDRKRAEERTRESESKYRRLVESTNSFVFTLDAEGKFEFFNRFWTDKVGYSAEEILGTNGFELITPETRDGTREQFAAAMNGTPVRNVEFRSRTKEGGFVDVLVDLTPVCDSAGKVLELLGTGVDITDRRVIEAERQEAQAFLETAIAHSLSGIVIADAPDVTIRMANPAALGIRGGAKSLLTGIPVQQHTARWQLLRADGSAYPPEELPLSRAVLRGEVTLAEEMIMRDEAGNDHWVDTNAAPIRDSAGQVTAGIVVFHDITDHKQAEKALRESRERLQHIVEVIADLVYEWDVATDTVEWYGDVDAALGYETGTIPRTMQGWLGLIHPEDMEKLAESVQELRESSVPIRITYRVRRKEGEWVWWEDFATPVLDATGSTVRWIGGCRDITRERALEEQYRQAQKMEAIGQLTGGVAHDFNNLLQVINGATEMTLTDLEDGHPAREWLQEAAKAGNRAARLVSQLLLFSRRQVIQPEVLNLNEAVEGALKMLRRVIGEHVRIAWVPGAQTGTVHADRGMIEQALMNLCVNARDAMPEGGTLTIETSKTMFDEDQCTAQAWAKPGQYALLSVTDSGRGMDKMTLEHVFEPFYTTKGLGKGTGLGLATVYGIMKQHDGMIHADSEPGKGSVFKLYWLASEAQIKAPTLEAEVAASEGTETILLAEDEDMVLDLAVRVLERAGYTVLTANNGAEAVALFEERLDEVDLVLLDVMMPEMGGREAYEKMCRRRPGLKALFASGYSEDAIHTNFVLDERLTLIQKPVAPKDLLRAVREALDRPSP